MLPDLADTYLDSTRARRSLPRRGADASTPRAGAVAGGREGGPAGARRRGARRRRRPEGVAAGRGAGAALGDLVWRLRFRVGLLRFGVAKWREREEEAAGIEKSAGVEKKIGAK